MSDEPIMGRIGSLSGLLCSFYFPLFYKSFLFSLYPFEQNRGRFIIRILRYKFAVNGKIKYLLAKFLRIHYSSDLCDSLNIKLQIRSAAF